MRYILQTLAMVGDVMLFLAIGCCTYCAFASKNYFVIFIAGCISILSLWCWYKTGAFEAWRPSRIKLFVKNAKKMGL